MEFPARQIPRAECPLPPREADRAECPTSLVSEKGVFTRVYLELTPVCNSRCAGCLNESFLADFSHRTLKSEFRQPFLSAAQWLAILSALPPTLNKVVLSGGEPTLHPEFEDILSGLEHSGVDYVIFSNGRWPTPGRLIALLRASTHFRGFLISLHGISAEAHDAFTEVSGSFCETVENVCNAIAAGLPVSLSMVLTRQNVDTLEAFVQMALEWGVEEISFNRYLYTSDRVEQLAYCIQPPDAAQLRDAVCRIERLRKRHAHQLRIGYGPVIPQSFAPSASQMCSAGESSLVIDPWGNVKPCSYANLRLGNLLWQDFHTIQQNEHLQMWQNLAVFHKPYGGGCRAMALACEDKKDPLISC